MLSHRPKQKKKKKKKKKKNSISRCIYTYTDSAVEYLHQRPRVPVHPSCLLTRQTQSIRSAPSRAIIYMHSVSPADTDHIKWTGTDRLADCLFKQNATTQSVVTSTDKTDGSKKYRYGAKTAKNFCNQLNYIHTRKILPTNHLKILYKDTCNRIVNKQNKLKPNCYWQDLHMLTIQ